ncbi:MAG: AAA family ATPase [Lachnospiraceae bacterium]|nr:AAA family ATPase [Lachnospiraceae bacterium]
MSEFDRVIGYERIKKELKLYCDAIKNPEKYRKIGANPPKGILIEGSPGTGKTLISNCFIKESGLGSITVRKKVSNGDFLKELRDVFEKAAKDTPYIVFLDDMDKFANNDAEHKDADEYAAIQALMDEYTKKGVFVIATINDSTDLPPSLLRPGRFDLTINVNYPRPKGHGLVTAQS